MLASAVAVVVVPGVAFTAGAWVMRKLADRAYVKARLRDAAAPEDRKPLNLRPLGYDADAVSRHWSALDDRALRSEARVLKLDLGFPILYGGVLLLSMLYVQVLMSDPGLKIWQWFPVAIAVAADWLENSILLSQLGRYRSASSLDGRSIRIASAATTLKCGGLVASFGAVIYSALALA